MLVGHVAGAAGELRDVTALDGLTNGLVSVGAITQDVPVACVFVNDCAYLVPLGTMKPLLERPDLIVAKRNTIGLYECDMQSIDRLVKQARSAQPPEARSPTAKPRARSRRRRQRRLSHRWESRYGGSETFNAAWSGDRRIRDGVCELC